MRFDIQPMVVIDTREPANPHPWSKWFTVETVRGTLQTGDFSLCGCEDFIAVERKSLNDLVSCLCAGRERFTRELQRAARIQDFYVICEGSYADLMRGDYRSAMNPKSAWESVIGLQSRYGTPFFMAGSVELAARLTESILIRWFKEHVRAVESAARGARVTDKARAATQGF